MGVPGNAVSGGLLAVLLAVAVVQLVLPTSGAEGFKVTHARYLAENSRLQAETRVLVAELGGGSPRPLALLEASASAPTIKCEEFMTGALKECRDAHVSCVKRAFETTAAKQTARAIRRAALDAKSMEEQHDEDEKNVQPQDMTPLQRRQEFAKDNGAAATPFAELKSTDHIKPSENVTEIAVDRESDRGSSSGSDGGGSESAGSSRGSSRVGGSFSNVGSSGKHAETDMDGGSRPDAITTAAKAPETLSDATASVSFRGRGSTRPVSTPISARSLAATSPADPPLPSLDRPTPAVLALQAKMQKELSTKLSRERNEEVRAEQGEEGAYTNAVQVLENAMKGQQTGFDRNTDARLKEGAQDIMGTYGSVMDAAED